MDCRLLFEKKSFQRRSIITDLVRIEDVYNRQLQYLQDAYMFPLQQEPTVLSLPECNRLFGNIDDLVACSTILLLRLNDEIRRVGEANLDAANIDVGKIMAATVGPHLKEFEIYALRFQSETSQTFCKYRERPVFANFLKTKENKSPSEPDLFYLLRLPLSRISKYEYAIRKLLQIALDDDPDLSSMRQFMQMCSNHLAAATTQMTTAANQFRLKDISRRVGGLTFELVQPTRKYIHEGPLMKPFSRGAHYRYFFLFSDMLLYCSGSDPQRGEGLRYKDRLMFHTEIISSIESIEDDPAKQRFNGFAINGSGKTIFILYADSIEEKGYWIELLSRHVVRGATPVRRHSSISPTQPTESPLLAQRVSECRRRIAEKQAAMLDASTISDNSELGLVKPVVLLVPEKDEPSPGDELKPATPVEPVPSPSPPPEVLELDKAEPAVEESPKLEKADAVPIPEPMPSDNAGATLGEETTPISLPDEVSVKADDQLEAPEAKTPEVTPPAIPDHEAGRPSTQTQATQAISPKVDEPSDFVEPTKASPEPTEPAVEPPAEKVSSQSLSSEENAPLPAADPEPGEAEPCVREQTFSPTLPLDNTSSSALANSSDESLDTSSSSAPSGVQVANEVLSSKLVDEAPCDQVKGAVESESPHEAQVETGMLDAEMRSNEAAQDSSIQNADKIAELDCSTSSSDTSFSAPPTFQETVKPESISTVDATFADSTALEPKTEEPQEEPSIATQQAAPESIEEQQPPLGDEEPFCDHSCPEPAAQPPPTSEAVTSDSSSEWVSFSGSIAEAVPPSAEDAATDKASAEKPLDSIFGTPSFPDIASTGDQPTTNDLAILQPPIDTDSSAPRKALVDDLDFVFGSDFKQPAVPPPVASKGNHDCIDPFDIFTAPAPAATTSPSPPLPPSQPSSNQFLDFFGDPFDKLWEKSGPSGGGGAPTTQPTETGGEILQVSTLIELHPSQPSVDQLKNDSGIFSNSLKDVAILSPNPRRNSAACSRSRSCPADGRSALLEPSAAAVPARNSLPGRIDTSAVSEVRGFLTVATDNNSRKQSYVYL